MTKFRLKDLDRDNEAVYDDKEKAQEQYAEFKDMGVNVELEEIDDGVSSNGDSGSETDDSVSEAVERVQSPTQEQERDTGDSDANTAHPLDETPAEPEPVEVVDPESLSKDPIGFLESVNTDFVNTIKGEPAISKQGFRFIQREFEISTESEVVQWIDDPLGVVVWAKAELPNGYSAEAHGEGYQFESDVSDNEFVRYADSRAKNRAISDLTAAGALAVEELQGSK